MTTRKPRPLKLDNTTARAIRGPHKDGSDRWYWRADLYLSGERRRETLWTGWATRDDARQEVSSLLAQRNPVEAAQEERAGRASEVQTVKDLLEVYLWHEQSRIALWQKEEEVGNAAVRSGAAKRTRHSRDALAPLTYKSKRTSAGRIAKSRLASVPLHRLRTEDARFYVAESRYAPGSVRNDVALLRAAWRWGQKDDRSYTTGDVSWPDVVATPVRAKYTPTREEVERTLAAMPTGWARDVLFVQSVLGCRIGALARLRNVPSDVDCDRGKVRLKVKGHDRTIRVPDEVLDVLRPYVEAGEKERPLWGVSKGVVLKVADLDRSPWGRACDKAGVLRIKTHAIRRMVCNEWLASGVSVVLYARVLGHSPEEALRAYAAVQGDDEVAAFVKARGAQKGNVVPLASRRSS